MKCSLYQKGLTDQRAVNLRLDDSVIVILNQLSDELHTTKTDVIEKAIEFFLKKIASNKTDCYNLRAN